MPLDAIRQAAATQALAWGLKPDTFQVVSDDNPPQPGTKSTFRQKRKHSLSATGNWEAKCEGETILLNAAVITPKDVPAKIRHEMAHLVYNDPAVQTALDTLFKSLPAHKRREIATTIKSHKGNDGREEAHARAFEILASGPRNLFEAFLDTIDKAWNRITNENSIPSSKKMILVNSIIEIGVSKLKEIEIPKEEEHEPV